jgi:hypothetical protein
MKVTLHTSALAAQSHADVVLPWLQRVAQTAARTRRTTAVIVPLRADAYHLKALALDARLALCGVHFLTPGELRDRLIRHLALPLRVPLREHLRLLLATAAERAGEGADAIAAAPDQLLKTIDLIGGGGWSFAEAGPAHLRPVAAEFARLLKGEGFSLVHDADRALLAAAPGAQPLFAELLVTGFNALHWPHWPLLEAAVRTADSATICLTDPRDEAQDLDAAWVGTWEETFGASQTVAVEISSPITDLLRLPESAHERAKREAAPAREVAFLVGHDTAEQARAIVTQALHFLADPACERLGVLFPAAGALSRRVATLLAEREVPHHDGLAHQAPGPLEDAAWPAWLELQESPRLPALLRFLSTRMDEEFAGLNAAKAADELQRVYQELLLDDLAVVAAYLARHSRRRHAPALAAALEALPFLPERAPLAAMIGRTGGIFADLGWGARAEELQRVAADWTGSLKFVISRRAWLRWLGESLVSWRTERAPAGMHPYSRLHLLPYAQAESRSWSHLIATGLNEGQWPPALEDTGFLGEEEIDALNRRLRGLNTRAVTQGRQGEGHVAVQPGRAFCLGPAQRRTLAARQFLNTLESATTAVALTAQLHDEAAPERPFNPGEFFTRLYFCARGRAVAKDTMTALYAETARWLAASGLWRTPAPDLADVQPTRRAYEARRASGQPFGEYEFALRTPPQPPLRLAAKRWEDALASPAEVWLAAVLGVAASGADDETPWALAQGNWVHDWLRAIAGSAPPKTFAPLPAPAELEVRVRKAAIAFRDRVIAVLATQQRALPDWWASAWEQALGVAALLAEGITQRSGVLPVAHPSPRAQRQTPPHESGAPHFEQTAAGSTPLLCADRTHVAVEWKFDDTAIPIGSGTLHIRGRIDLLLTTSASLDDAWLIDYKTGNRKGLSLKTLARGDGVQLALYALALRAAGAHAVGLSLLTPGAPLEAPQLSLADLDKLGPLWRGLLRMQESGVFGMHGALREEYGHRRDYPLATLAIDGEVLAEKWTLTHPDFADGEDEG